MTTKSENMGTDQAPPQTAPDPDDEFDAAMAEATAEDSAPAPAAADDPPASDAHGTGGPPAPADEAAAKDAPPADGQTSPDGTPQDDIWATAPAELRQAYEQTKRDAELRLKSVQGRQSATDRELQRLRQEVEQLRSGKAPATEGGDEGRKDDGQPKDDRFKELREEYPEIAGPLLDYISELEGKLKPLEQGIGTVQQERTQAFIDSQEKILAERHPDWLETLKDDRFGGWLEEQPRRVKEALKRNFEFIVDGEEAAWVVGEFKSAMGIKPKDDPTPTPSPTPQDERRQKQLANGRDFGRGNGPPVTEGIPDDFDAALDAFAARKDKELAAGR